MAAEFGQYEDVWQSGISCGGGWFANSICCGGGYCANSVTYVGVNPGVLVTVNGRTTMGAGCGRYFY